MVIWYIIGSLKQTEAILLALLFLFTMRSNHDDHSVVNQHVQDGTQVPLEQIIEAARAEHPGDILQIASYENQELPIYQVELIDAADVIWSMRYDATTGILLQAQADKRAGKRPRQLGNRPKGSRGNRSPH